MKKYETKYLAFKVEEGPKVVIDNLNTEGKEGWKLETIMVVGEGQLIAFVTREIDIQAPDPEKSKKDSISKLWGGSEDA